MTPLPIDPRVREYFSYDPETGAILWRKDMRGGRNHNRAVAVAGTVAGSIVAMNGCLYRQTRLFDARYLGHRVAWYMMTGEEPPMQIDHIDCDGTNNAWRNLRAATPAQNLANRRNYGTYKKGVTRAPKRRFCARIREGGKYVYLGTFDTEDEAHQAYHRRAVELYGEFAREG